MEHILALEREEEFLAAALRYAVGLAQGHTAALLTLANAHSVSTRMTILGAGIPPTVFSSPEIQQTALQALAQGAVFAVPSRQLKDTQFVAAPVSAEEDQTLALGAFVPVTVSQASTQMAFQLATQLFERRRQRNEAEALESGFRRAMTLLEVFNRAGLSEEFGLAVATMSSELRELIGCEQIAIGLGTPSRCQVVAISGGSQHDVRSQTSNLLSQAMREALGVDRATLWPATAYLPDQILPAGNLDRLLEATAMRTVVTFPLVTESDEKIGALCCLWKDEIPFTSKQWQFVQAITPHLASVLGLLRAAKPRGVNANLRKIWPKKSVWKRIALLTFPLVFAGAMIIPVPHRITADCELQPKTKRQVAAPFNGILEEPHVKPGEIVSKGQLLATLDGKEIGLKLSETTFKYHATLKLRDQAMAVDDVPTTHLEQLNAEALNLEMDLLKNRQENLQIRSPIDGLILSGNLEQSEGVPVSEGQQLFEIAPIEELIVEVSVSDSDISYVETGMEVALRLESQLSYNFSGEVESVHPISEIKNEKNVFVCQTTIPNVDGNLRPGMGGKARIKSGTRPLGWVLFHKPWNFIRMRFW